MRPEHTSLLYLHLAAFLFGGTTLFAKLIELPAIDITVYRTAIACLALTVLLLIQRKKLALQCLKDYVIITLLGIIIGLHWVTYFASMQMAGIAIGVISLFTYPVITVLLEPLFSKSRLQKSDVVCAILVLTGIYLLIPEADLGNQVTLGVLVGVTSGALFSLRNILQKYHFTGYGGSQTMLYQTLVASLMLCAFISVPPAELSNNHIGLLLFAGIIFTALPHALFSSSLRHLSATTAGLICCLQPLYATLLAFMLLSEKPSVVTLIGGLLVVSAALFETWSVTRKKA